MFFLNTPKTFDQASLHKNQFISGNQNTDIDFMKISSNLVNIIQKLEHATPL